VIGVCERDDSLTTGRHPGKFESDFDRVGASWTGKSDSVVEAAWHQDGLLQRGDEIVLCRRVEIERMGDAVRLQVGDDSILDCRRIMAVIQRAGTGQKIDIATTVLVDDRGTFGGYEQHREIAAITAHTGL